MRYGYREECLAHETGDRHPEHPDRLRAIRSTLSRLHGTDFVAGDLASRAAVAAIHSEDYIDAVEAFCADGGGHWDGDTVAVAATWEAALASAGLACWTARSALDGADGRETPFALGRPPGHHALADDAMGFCFFNNVAVAAATALAETDRVAIVDWDVHHGNGTQDVFYDRGDVYYASIHERDLFPGTGSVAQTGSGAGKGTTVNAPLPGGSGDAAVLAVLDDVIAPTLTAFDPGLVLVSAGFDAHVRDPISRLRVTGEGFGVLAARLRGLAERTDAPIGFVLEGGYGLESLAEGVRTVHEVFDGREPVEPDEDPGADVRSVIGDLRAVHGLGSR